jgi:hypothetical protein
MMSKRDMRYKANKQHLGNASNRDAYEQQKSVVVKDSRKPAEPMPKKDSK